ncbi:hypothetical protein [Paraflavitalea speifideaquila]|uniref:hypothetical protein n=1 Tax=Paraflavitalea speifideaquila TaxID=3076558 RepID=UPI0028EE7E03|nr:hypothetical protein [Paraflavitalea speifideiaquila]
MLGTLANRKAGGGDVLMHGLYAGLFQDNRPVGGWSSPPAKEKKTMVQQPAANNAVPGKEPIKPKSGIPTKIILPIEPVKAMAEPAAKGSFVQDAALMQQSVTSQAEKDRIQSLRDQEQMEHDKKQAIIDRQQADRDRLQAIRDREQAVKDHIQADKDRYQAELDRQQAARDKLQADRDRQQAELDRKQADKDRTQAEIDRKQADRDRAEAEHYRIQSGKIKATTALPAM